VIPVIQGATASEAAMMGGQTGERLRILALRILALAEPSPGS